MIEIKYDEEIEQNENSDDYSSEAEAALVYMRCISCRWHTGNFKCKKRYIADGLPVYCSYYESCENAE